MSPIPDSIKQRHREEIENAKAMTPAEKLFVGGIPFNAECARLTAKTQREQPGISCEAVLWRNSVADYGPKMTVTTRCCIARYHRTREIADSCCIWTGHMNEMRISFDLDDTLIRYREGAVNEALPPWYRRLFASIEPMRRGVDGGYNQGVRAGVHDPITRPAEKRGGEQVKNVLKKDLSLFLLPLFLLPFFCFCPFFCFNFNIQQ